MSREPCLPSNCHGRLEGVTGSALLPDLMLNAVRYHFLVLLPLKTPSHPPRFKMSDPIELEGFSTRLNLAEKVQSQKLSRSRPGHKVMNIRATVLLICLLQTPTNPFTQHATPSFLCKCCGVASHVWKSSEASRTMSPHLVLRRNSGSQLRKPTCRSA